MFDNKFFINLYVLSLDKSFELYIPVNEKIGNIVKLIKSSLLEYNVTEKNDKLFSLYSGRLYDNNEIVRDTDIKNGTKLILI